MELMKALIANNTDYAFPVLYSAVERELVNAASSSSAASMPMQGVLIPVCSVRGVCVCVFVNFSFPLVVPNLDLPTRPSLCFGCHPTAADRRSRGISLRRTWGGCCWRQRRAPARGSPRNGLSAGLLSLPSTMAKSTLERWVTAVVMDDARGGARLACWGSSPALDRTSPPFALCGQVVRSMAVELEEFAAAAPHSLTARLMDVADLMVALMKVIGGEVLLCVFICCCCWGKRGGGAR